MNSSAIPEGPGSVSGAPYLPDGFTGTFTSRYVDTGDLRQHVVTGGEGPPLLLVHGWPQTWYAWRLMMLDLAQDFQVIAPDQRGCGLSGKPPGRYDTGTLAGDLVALMDALGHRRFAVAGHDTGMWISYALAADHPGRVACLAVAETPLPGVSLSPPLFSSAHVNDRLWHFAFNRLAEVNEQPHRPLHRAEAAVTARKGSRGLRTDSTRHRACRDRYARDRGDLGALGGRGPVQRPCPLRGGTIGGPASHLEPL
jgi:pimeloyl-ACP methyl ester carboxylesterase